MAIFDTISGLLLPMPSAETGGRPGQAVPRAGQVEASDTSTPAQFGQVLQAVSQRVPQASDALSLASLSSPAQQRVSVQDVRLQTLTARDAQAGSAAAGPVLTAAAEVASESGTEPAEPATPDILVAVSFDRPERDVSLAIDRNIAASGLESTATADNAAPSSAASTLPVEESTNPGRPEASSNIPSRSGAQDSPAQPPAFAGVLPENAEASETATTRLAQLASSFAEQAVSDGESQAAPPNSGSQAGAERGVNPAPRSFVLAASTEASPPEIPSGPQAAQALADVLHMGATSPNGSSPQDQAPSLDGESATTRTSESESRAAVLPRLPVAQSGATAEAPLQTSPPATIDTPSMETPRPDRPLARTDLEPMSLPGRMAIAASLSPRIESGDEHRLIGETVRPASRQGIAAISASEQTGTMSPNDAAARPFSTTTPETLTREASQSPPQDMSAALSNRQGSFQQNIARGFQALLQGHDRAMSGGAIPAAASSSAGGLEQALGGLGFELASANATGASNGQPPASPSSASAAPASQHPPQPPATPAMQVGLSIGKAAAEGRQRFTLRLDPPELGRIDVKLEMGGEGHLRAVIRADSRETLELLQRDARHLERALTDAGVKTDSGSLNFSLNQQGQNGGLAFSSGGEGSLTGQEGLASGHEAGAEDPDMEPAEDMTNLELAAIDSDSIDIRV